jgi:hypothetical protein
MTMEIGSPRGCITFLQDQPVLIVSMAWSFETLEFCVVVDVPNGITTWNDVE